MSSIRSQIFLLKQKKMCYCSEEDTHMCKIAKEIQ